LAGRINKIVNLIGNMGWRYVGFRAGHELMRRTGLLKRKFPAAPSFKQYITLAQWKQHDAVFFFESRESLRIQSRPEPELKERFEAIMAGKVLLFSSIEKDLGQHYDWVTNPDSGFRYDASKHWTEIADISKEAGDIKYVWEKSRFSYLYDIIRYDYHFGVDCAEKVFADILSWIQSNPVNCGPNYRCSQEMSLRVMNWTFALHYYKHSPFLTEEVFNQMQYAIYWHLHHIYNNIGFSRIAVRNNHAITETLMLYLAGIFYPTMRGVQQWSEKGKRWFEEEIAYQVYEDGTFLQFSMNYHRIVVQLLTWGIVLSEKNGQKISNVVYDRAHKSVQFLRTCMVDENGWLPNYGANDGALFFKLSSTNYRDYRPQIQALAAVLGIDVGLPAGEDLGWYGITRPVSQKWQPEDGANQFELGGYYVIREPKTLTFIKCGGYKDRPQHADNLHLDIWYKGVNILPDAGSYKYNTDDATIRYFSGTRSHNTVMLGDNDQMLKGGRFIWYYWSQRKQARLKEEDNAYVFDGSARAFTYMHKDIVHSRKVVKHKGRPVWEIRDEVSGTPTGVDMRQMWHLPKQLLQAVTITAAGEDDQAIQPVAVEGWYSSLYGQKEATKELYFSSVGREIRTLIKVD
jgi:hypothetical protein